MEFPTLITKLRTKKFRAFSPLFGLDAVDTTPELATSKLAKRIEGLAARGVECRHLDIPSIKNPLDGLRRGGDFLRPGATAEALFLIPTNLTRPFFASLLQYWETHVNDVFGDQLRTILRYVPRDEQEFHATEVVSLLRREFRQSNNIRVLVVAPTGSSQLTAEIVDFVKREKLDIPIIAVTIPFRRQSLFRSNSLDEPNFVICNSQEGARKLGEDAAARFPAQLKTLNVVMIHGPKGRIDSRARLTGFAEGLTASGRRIRRVPSDSNIYCDWNAQKAHDTFLDIVQSERKSIHVVFAANDEMALGVRRAIASLPENNKRRLKQCLIYGFDAIPEMCDYIKDNDPHIKGTLKQPMEMMARELVDLMKQASNGTGSLLTSPPSGRGVFVDPKPFVAKRNTDKSKTVSPAVAPPPYKKSADWALSTDKELLPTGFGGKVTLDRYARMSESRFEDEHGVYGVHGKKDVRKFRVVNGKVYWYIKGWRKNGKNA